MRSGNYEGGQRKVIFTLWIRSEHLHTVEVDNITVSALMPLVNFYQHGSLDCEIQGRY